MENIEEKKYWIWLSLIPNLGSRKKQELLKRYQKPEKIYQLKKEELMEIRGIGEKTIFHVLNENIKMEVGKHIEYMQKNNIDIISIYDEEYPKILKGIYDPPISLYCKGNSKILNQKSMAIVGCRDVSDYGKKATKYFSYHLARQGINIVSGLARGVDSYAHVGAICGENKSYPQQNKKEQSGNCGKCGKTIAIMGNGLDSIYPKENEFLAEKIVKKGGAILSEYPLGVKPDKMNFPARNRIISGMCQGVLVVEAKEKSGTLITVDFALEQGREVFVVPRKY